MNVADVLEILRRVNPETELGSRASELLQSVGALSSREMEVLQHLARGETTREIADELCVSMHTVRNHVAKILAKTNTHSTREAVVAAVRIGLLTIDDLGQPDKHGSEVRNDDRG
jgi:DNA-binding NarL/FixJ family response regulator